MSANRDQLEALVHRAEKLLEGNSPFHTEGAKLALADMLEKAKKALSEGDKPPFVRNREFYRPREEEAVLFAMERFTMVPPFQGAGKVYTHYGLKQALEWFEEQDIRRGGMEKLREKAALAKAKAEELLRNAGFGEETGCFSGTAAQQLKDTVLKLEAALDGGHNGGLEELAGATVACFNSLKELRHSRVLRTDIDPEASLYLTREGLEQVKANIASDPLLKEQYANIARIAGHYSEEDIQQAVSLIMNGNGSYEELNRHFYLWSSTDKIVNFKAPEGAAKAAISFVLPAEENEEDGLGHVWIDNLRSAERPARSKLGGQIPVLRGRGQTPTGVCQSVIPGEHPL
ncbi:hypothetical protein [Paenibacillus sp. YN15]|uniref:hypothetical protein n=1 Tax=Paenibacillus sp. YN15 TaxID=1742774 RepID=UPI00215D1718|nr:hypothetical protein [Paenibacillus sp. YN15]